jgi:hypothetical protein
MKLIIEKTFYMISPVSGGGGMIDNSLNVP